MRVTVALLTLTLMLVPMLAQSVGVPQDDAGSGQDAPNFAADHIVVAPGVVYDGLLVSGVDHFDWYAFEAPASTDLAFSTVGSATCIGLFAGVDARHLSTSCTSEDGASFYEARSSVAGTYYLRVGAGLGQAAAYKFVLAIGGSAPHPVLPSDPMSIGNDPTCGTGVPVTRNGGHSDGVTFAALKTGFRAIVAYTTELPTIETVTWGIDGGDTTTTSDATPRREHVFLFDGLPIGRSFCFTAGDGVPRAMKLVNAMTSFDGTQYTANLLATAPLNAAHRDILEDGFDIFAEKLYDSTDGWVRAGQIVLLFHPEHVNSGTITCSGWGSPIGGSPTCDQRVDVTYSYDSCIGGAACAPLDGIGHPTRFIMMNSIYDANPATGGLLYGANEAGSVLVHEFGHYAFGSADLYVAGDCYDAALSLSIMGASRRVTEVDDEVHRCPNEASLNNYIPTWTRMRARFPSIPDRTGPIDEGPHGGGSAYAQHTLSITPSVDHVDDTEVPQDDAGSGGDAGASVATALDIDAGILYDGTLLVGDRDVYRFAIAPGQAFEAVAYPGGTCIAVTDATGHAVPGATCVNEGVRARVAGTAPGGPLYIHVGGSAQAVYKVGVGVDEAAPSPV